MKTIIGFFVILCLGFELFDMFSPNHHTGDIQGYIIFCRLFRLTPVILLCGLGFILLYFGDRCSKRSLKMTGYFFAYLSCLLLFLISLEAGISRRQWAIRNTYPSKSTTELIQLANSKEDKFAIDVFFQRKDPNAVPGLASILFDQTKRTSLRSVAAHALGAIGNNEAETVLLEAQQSIQEHSIRESIDYALDVRIRGNVHLTELKDM